MSTHIAPASPRCRPLDPAGRRALAAAAAELGAALDELARLDAECVDPTRDFDDLFDPAVARRDAAAGRLFGLMERLEVPAVIAGGKLYTGWAAEVRTPGEEPMVRGHCFAAAARFVNLDA